VRKDLWPGEWSFHFVINKVKHAEELAIFHNTEVEIIQLCDVLGELKAKTPFTAAGKDLVDLMVLDESTSGN
jgi:hypothetical protein